MGRHQRACFTHQRPRLRGRESGAVAVEMAFLLPILIFLVFGIIDFSRALNAQIQVSQAAREGVRLVAMNVTTDPTSRVRQAAPQLNASDISVSTQACTTGVTNAQVTVNYQFTWLTGISAMSRMFGSGFTTPTTITAVGVMQCGG